MIASRLTLLGTSLLLGEHDGLTTGECLLDFSLRWKEGFRSIIVSRGHCPPDLDFAVRFQGFSRGGSAALLFDHLCDRHHGAPRRGGPRPTRGHVRGHFPVPGCVVVPQKGARRGPTSTALRPGSPPPRSWPRTQLQGRPPGVPQVRRLPAARRFRFRRRTSSALCRLAARHSLALGRSFTLADPSRRPLALAEEPNPLNCLPSPPRPQAGTGRRGSRVHDRPGGA